MQNFEYYAPTKIIFGKETEKDVGKLISAHGGRVLLHYGSQSSESSGLLDRVRSSLRGSGVRFAELGGVKPNPKLFLVKEGIGLAQEEQIDAVLAVGGGSVIDSAKAIAMGACYNGDVWDFYTGKATPEKALPVACILTIPAAGSEMSNRSVISNEDRQLKLRAMSDLIRPVFSIINPELFTSLPKPQIANGVTDILSHIFERYFTNTGSTALIDAMSEAAMRTVLKYGLKVYEDPSDYDAWAEIGFAGTIAHNDTLGVGRQQDWASHNIEHEISAIYDIAHGAGLAIVIPAWMEYVCRTNIHMFVQFAVNVMGVPLEGRDPLRTAREGIKALSSYYKRIGQPLKFSDLDIGSDRFEEMAKKATNFGTDKETKLGNLQKLGWEDIVNILEMAK